MQGLGGGLGASSDSDDAFHLGDPKSPKSSPVPPRSAGDARSAAAQDPADARDIEELLAGLSRLRLAMSAELSATAGALDAQRPDIASDLLGGARIELQRLRVAVVKQGARQLAPALTAAGPEDTGPIGAARSSGEGSVVPRSHRAHRKVKVGNWQGRVLAGALALGLALMALPHSSRDGGSSSKPNAAQVQSIDVKLVSSEFSTLRQTLQAKSPAAASILAAGQVWHTAVARTLPNASTHATTATQIVALLREERALLATPAMGTPAMREAAVELKSSADGLLAQLRSLATTQVLAVLPTAITALPLPTPIPTPSPTEPPVTTVVVPSPGVTPPPPTAPSTPVAPVTPAPTATVPSVPAPTTVATIPPSPLPSPIALPSLPNLIGNLGTLGGLTTTQDTTGSTVTTHSSGSGSTSKDTVPSSPQATPTAPGAGS